MLVKNNFSVPFKVSVTFPFLYNCLLIKQEVTRSSPVSLLLCHRSNSLVFLDLSIIIIPTKTPLRLKSSAPRVSGGGRGIRVGKQEEAQYEVDTIRRSLPNLQMHVPDTTADHSWSFPFFCFACPLTLPRQRERQLHVLKMISSGRVIEWAAAFKWNWWNGSVRVLTARVCV